MTHLLRADLGRTSDNPSRFVAHSDPELIVAAGDYLPWGACALTFDLPVSRVRLEGLTTGQRAALVSAYPGFTESEAPYVDRNIPVCRVCRLTESPGLASKVLMRDGQYSPRKVRTKDAIELTGVNFRASISINERTSRASLGVVHEHELSYANVIENFLRIFAAHHVLGRKGVVLHSAGLVFDGAAYIFVGRSGVGKSTLTRKAYAKGARVLSDDFNVLLPHDGGYHAWAVPFAGEFGRTLEQTDGPPSYPVAGIVLLEQGSRLEARPVGASAAVSRLLVGSPFVNMDADESDVLFDVLSDLAARIPVLAMACRRDDDVNDIMKAVTEGIASDRHAA